jgi:hypothetical protein
MKIKTILSLLLVSISMNSFSQLTYSVSPGFNLNSASIGYSFGKLNPYAGIQVYSISEKSKKIRDNVPTKDIYRMNFLCLR